MANKKTESDHKAEALDALVDAALMHVMFDGWTPTTFQAAVADSGVDDALAQQAAPRGAIDLAVAFHKRGDRQMVAAIDAADMSDMRYSEKVAFAVRTRLEAAAKHREAVRRGATLFSLPHNGPEGTSMVWGTADAIWRALGDTSEDFNYYTKRATLSGVYTSTLLYWLGDDSEDFANTWAFLDRRIEDVMQIEKVKSAMKSNPLGKMVLAGPEMLFSLIKAPKPSVPEDLPGYTGPRT
ncbi:MAG: COQ9 family protein [Pseudomonadota bacterium]